MSNEITEALSLKMKSLIENYERYMRALFELNQQEEDQAGMMRRQEGFLLKEVLEAKTEEGKAKYTNQQQRDIALQDKKDNDEDYRKYKIIYDQTVSKIKAIRLELDIIEHKSRNYRKVIDLEISRIQLNAAQLTRDASMYNFVKN